MVKSVLGVHHQGLRDWVLQRVTAVVMAVYSLSIIIYLLIHTHLSFAEWHSLFAMTWVKVATLLTISSMLIHAWMGIWTVFTDYIKCAALRATLNVLVWIGLAACFFWALLILWSV